MKHSFLWHAMKNGLTSNPKYFVSTSIMAMKRLSSGNKPNLVYKFSQMLTLQKTTNSPVLQLDRMQFGLLDYIIQFFTAVNVNHVICFLLVNNLHYQSFCDQTHAVKYLYVYTVKLVILE